MSWNKFIRLPWVIFGSVRSTTTVHTEKMNVAKYYALAWAIKFVQWNNECKNGSNRRTIETTTKRINLVQITNAWWSGLNQVLLTHFLIRSFQIAYTQLLKPVSTIGILVMTFMVVDDRHCLLLQSVYHTEMQCFSRIVM